MYVRGCLWKKYPALCVLAILSSLFHKKEKTWQTYSVILLHSEEECWGMRRWWLKEEEQEESQFMWIPCAVSKNVQEEENIESHPILPPVFVITNSLCAVLGVWVGKQCFPAESQRYSSGGSEKGALKRGGLGGIQARVAFSFKQCVGRPSGAHRHAIPSPTDIILHQPHRGDAGGVRRGGTTDWTEELFRLRRDKDWWGGVTREMWAQLQLVKQCRWDCYFSNSNPMVLILIANSRQGDELISDCFYLYLPRTGSLTG